MIDFKCSVCHRNLRIRDDAAAGKRGKCPHCGATVLVPDDLVIIESADAPIVKALEVASVVKVPSVRQNVPIQQKPMADRQSPPTVAVPQKRRKHRRWVM